MILRQDYFFLEPAEQVRNFRHLLIRDFPKRPHVTHHQLKLRGVLGVCVGIVDGIGKHRPKTLRRLCVFGADGIRWTDRQRPTSGDDQQYAGKQCSHGQSPSGNL